MKSFPVVAYVHDFSLIFYKAQQDTKCMTL